MSFSIVHTRPGMVQLVLLRELDTSAVSLLRRELATVMSSNPNEVELRVPDGSFLGSAGLHVLASFFDIMWARGCQFSFVRGWTPPVPVGDETKLRRLLSGRDESSARA